MKSAEDKSVSANGTCSDAMPVVFIHITEPTLTVLCPFNQS